MAVEWGGRALALSPKDAALWEKTGSQTEAHRCGAAVIRVIDGDGQPLSGVPVRYEQRRSAFRFGVHYPYQARAFDLFQAAGINAATLWLGWADVEPEPGAFNLDYLERVWNPLALHERGLRLTAHAINWLKPAWRVLPEYLRALPVSDLPRLAYEHTRRIVQRWSPYIDTYELVHEPCWPGARALPLAVEDMVRLCHATALAVRDVYPEARLEVSFSEVSRLPTYTVRPLDFLAALERAGVPYHTIGLQLFENAYSASQPPLYYRSKTLSGILQSQHYYAALGKPLHVTALAAPSVAPPGKPPTYFKPPYGPWNEETQARYLDAAYTYLFAEPQVQGITWWCPVDGRLSYIRGGGLLRQDLSPKPAYAALQQWTARHTSSGQLRSDVEGKAYLRGQAGEYDVAVGVGVLGRSLSLSIEAGGVNEQTVVLAYNP
jgi:endo-1,4-beta-xylanase